MKAFGLSEALEGLVRVLRSLSKPAKALDGLEALIKPSEALKGSDRDI